MALVCGALGTGCLRLRRGGCSPDLSPDPPPRLPSDFASGAASALVTVAPLVSLVMEPSGRHSSSVLGGFKPWGYFLRTPLEDVSLCVGGHVWESVYESVGV